MKKLSKRQKKIIWSLSFWTIAGILFLAASALLVLWASGYKYNFLAHKFQKTGIIYLTTDPKNVDIYLDGKLIKQKTPAKISYLLPGRYKIEIKKKNYHNWVQEVEVESNKVKRFDNIILFYSQPKSFEISKNVQSFFLSPDKNKLIYQSDSFYLYDLKNFSPKKIAENNFSFISWSANSNKILFKNQNSLYYYNLSNSTLSPIQSNELLNYQKVLWQPTDDNNLFALVNNNLYLLNLDTGPKLLANGISDFNVGSNNLYYITNTDQKIILQKANLDFTNPYEIAELSDAQSQIILKEPYVFIKDSKNNLFQISQNAQEKINGNIKLFTWSENSSFFGLMKNIKFLYNTNLDDIYSYDPGTKNNKFIYRTVKPIQKIEWYSDLNYLIFSADSEIKIIGIDGKNEILIAKGNDFKIIEASKIIILDPENHLKIFQIRD